MSEHLAKITWSNRDEPFVDNQYSRSHVWDLDGGLRIPASASPHLVPPSCTDTGAIDPEEAFVASLASCHMLWFLSIAARAGYVVRWYRDEAFGVLGPDETGRTAMLKVTLRPRVAFSGDRRPSELEFREMHEEAHERCFLARSVRTVLECEPMDTTDASLEGGG